EVGARFESLFECSLNFQSASYLNRQCIHIGRMSQCCTSWSQCSIASCATLTKNMFFAGGLVELGLEKEIDVCGNEYECLWVKSINTVINYVEPALLEIMPELHKVPVIHEILVFKALAHVKRTATGPDDMPFW
ncbi:unnamed protein product, partial [Porites lobata]